MNKKIIVAITGSSHRVRETLASHLAPLEETIDMMEPYLKRLSLLTPVVGNDKPRASLGNMSPEEFVQRDRDHCYQSAPTLSSVWLRRELILRKKWLIHGIQTVQEIEVCKDHKMLLYWLNAPEDLVCNTIFTFMAEAKPVTLENHAPEAYAAIAHTIMQDAEKYCRAQMA